MLQRNLLTAYRQLPAQDGFTPNVIDSESAHQLLHRLPELLRR